MAKLVDAKLDKCPYCGGTEFIDAGMQGESSVKFIKKMRTVPVCVVICRDCGSVVRIYSDQSEKLLPLFKRRRKAKKAAKENKKAEKKQKQSKVTDEQQVVDINPVVEVVEPND